MLTSDAFTKYLFEKSSKGFRQTPSKVTFSTTEKPKARNEDMKDFSPIRNTTLNTTAPATKPLQTTTPVEATTTKIPKEKDSTTSTKKYDHSTAAGTTSYPAGSSASVSFTESLLKKADL
jgi:hypothetical protein